jgi:hypothetical protein
MARDCAAISAAGDDDNGVCDCNGIEMNQMQATEALLLLYAITCAQLGMRRVGYFNLLLAGVVSIARAFK